MDYSYTLMSIRNVLKLTIDFRHKSPPPKEVAKKMKTIRLIDVVPVFNIYDIAKCLDRQDN